MAGRYRQGRHSRLARERADCVIRAEKTLFDGITRGETSAVAAVLRGDIVIEGDRELLVLFQRLFPGPRGERR